MLYTSVGHAGASAYIAIMSLLGISAVVIKPTALALNIVVALFTSYSYIRAKQFDYKLVVPLIIGAIPLAYLGGRLNLPNLMYKPIVGFILLYSAYKFIFIEKIRINETKIFNKLNPVLAGGIVGFLSGLTGTGGGIFLSPIILILGWTTLRKASGTVSLFILFNSIFGFLGNINSANNFPNTLSLYIIFVLFGAFIGTRFGVKYLTHLGIKRALGFVLLIASIKLIFSL